MISADIKVSLVAAQILEIMPNVVPTNIDWNRSEIVYAPADTPQTDRLFPIDMPRNWKETATFTNDPNQIEQLGGLGSSVRIFQGIATSVSTDVYKNSTPDNDPEAYILRNASSSEATAHDQLVGGLYLAKSIDTSTKMMALDRLRNAASEFLSYGDLVFAGMTLDVAAAMAAKEAQDPSSTEERSQPFRLISKQLRNDAYNVWSRDVIDSSIRRQHLFAQLAFFNAFAAGNTRSIQYSLNSFSKIYEDIHLGNRNGRRNPFYDHARAADNALRSAYYSALIHPEALGGAVLRLLKARDLVGKKSDRYLEIHNIIGNILNSPNYSDDDAISWGCRNLYRG